MRLKKLMAIGSDFIETINKGWVYSFHGTLSSNANTDFRQIRVRRQLPFFQTGRISVKQATTSSQIVARADAGEKFPIIKQDGDWYEISLPSGESAFIAKWVVSTGDEVTL